MTRPLDQRIVEIQRELAYQHREHPKGWPDAVRKLEHERAMICHELKQLKKAGQA